MKKKSGRACMRFPCWFPSYSTSQNTTSQEASLKLSQQVHICSGLVWSTRFSFELLKGLKLAISRSQSAGPSSTGSKFIEYLRPRPLTELFLAPLPPLFQGWHLKAFLDGDRFQPTLIERFPFPKVALFKKVWSVFRDDIYSPPLLCVYSLGATTIRHRESTSLK